VNRAPDKLHRIVRWSVLAAYVAGVGSIVFRAGNPTESFWRLSALPFSLWMIAPIAVPLLLRIRHWLLTGGVAAMAVYGLYVYERDMFGPDVRSTSGLILIFLPIYQWVGTAVLIVVAAVMSRRKSH